MAKVGEGDSRWIVSRRADGKNVDNWHWTEKDLFSWCQGQFEMYFKEVAIPSTKAQLQIEKAESVKGSMVVCNRKGKTFYVFDVQLKLEWKGSINNGQEETTAKGTINVDDIANDEDKWKVTVRMEGENAQNKILKEEMQNNVGSIIDGIVNNVLEEMKGKIQDEGGAASSSTKSNTAASTKPNESQRKPAEQKSRIIETSSTSETKSSKISTKSFTQQLVFEVPPQIVYETLLDQNRVAAFTGGPAKVENKNGGEFFIFDNAVNGTQVELVPHKKIVQKWRFQTWPENHYSTVTITLDNEGNSTLLTLTQKDIPSSDYDRTCGGWESFFWQRIRGLFGWSYKFK